MGRGVLQLLGFEAIRLYVLANNALPDSAFPAVARNTSFRRITAFNRLTGLLYYICPVAH